MVSVSRAGQVTAGPWPGVISQVPADSDSGRRATLVGMEPQMVHDTPLIPLHQELSFVEGVTIDTSDDLDVDELLRRAAACDRAAAAPPAPTASSAGAARRRQRYAHQALVYRRLASER